MTSPLSSEELAGRIFDALLFDEELTKKAVCIYAIQKCMPVLGAELSEDLAKIVCRSGLQGSAKFRNISDRVKKVMDNNPDLVKKSEEVD